MRPGSWSATLFTEPSPPTLRRGELRALRCDDLDRGVIVVARGWDDVEGERATKTIAGERRVPIVAQLKAELVLHLLATERGGTDLVFGQTASVRSRRASSIATRRPRGRPRDSSRRRSTPGVTVS